ncbi:uncharacterized protein LODBEIA_P40390 [Lodderomyces beijingensis]|uniref:Uncharacterized protein n=1 Tax=Lodderomyces beijingensis TaxID=1775926 RepID=A0ABP0ZRJ6_9ASCO
MKRTSSTLASSSSYTTTSTTKFFSAKRCKIEHEIFSTSIKDIEKLFTQQDRFCTQSSSTAASSPPPTTAATTHMANGKCGIAPRQQAEIVQNRPLKFPRFRNQSQTRPSPNTLTTTPITTTTPLNFVPNQTGPLHESSFQYLDHPNLPRAYSNFNYDCINMALLEDDDEEEEQEQEQQQQQQQMCVQTPQIESQRCLSTASAVKDLSFTFLEDVDDDDDDELVVGGCSGYYAANIQSDLLMIDSLLMRGLTH